MAMLNNQRVRNATSFWKDMWYVFKNAGFLYPSSAQKNRPFEKSAWGKKARKIHHLFPWFSHNIIYIWLVA